MDKRQEMLDEIRACLSPDVPSHAITFKELREIMNEGRNVPVGESTLHKQLQAKIKEGTWDKARRGKNTYYWKIQK